MATKLAVIVADFTTQLATAMAIGATSVSLQSATDDDGIALPAGVYFFAIDGNNSQKEHIVATLSGTSLTGISSVSRQGVQVSGTVRSHRVGSTVTLTDFAHIRYLNDLLSGTTNLNASVPLGYDGTASITTANQLATKAYVDGVAVAGAPNASTTVKGIVQEATQAQVLSKTAAGSTAAELYINPATLPSTLLSDYKVDTGAANAYVITPAPAITAYVTGQVFSFKAVNANTTASTLNVNALGVKAIVNSKGGALVANDILAGMIVTVEYDGTSMVMQNPVANAPTTAPVGQQYASQVFTVSGTWTRPAGVTSVKVTVVGGGGGGGGTDANAGAIGGFGGAGSVAIAKLTVAGNISVTVGAAGAGGTGGATPTGGTGGSSIFSTVTAAGGNGGTGKTGGSGGAAGGAGGTATGGDINLTGAAGLTGTSTANIKGGADAPLGFGVGAYSVTSSGGNVAVNFGSGGGAGVGTGSNTNGGAGGAGLVIVEWIA